MLSITTSRAQAAAVRVVLLASLILVAVAAISAASANAAFTAPYTVKCTGDSITGRGSSFQKVAQAAFTAFWSTDTAATSTAGCGPAASQTITYQPNGSGAGRAAFGAAGTGRDPLVRFTAFDEAPTAAQRTAMEAAQGGTGAGKLAVTPAAAGATTLIVHFPHFCELAAGDPDLAPYARFKVSNARLEQAWEGGSALDQWGELLPGIQAIPGNALGKTNAQCQAESLKRVVRFDSSGTTFSFKQFLSGVNPGFNWLTAYSNTAWPGSVTVADSNGAGAVVDKVKATAGSIGYADLATAREKGMKKQSSVSWDPAQYKYDGTNQVSPFAAYNWTYTFSKFLFWIPLEQATAAHPATGSGVYKEPTNDPISIRNNREGANCGGVSYNNVPTSGGSPDVFGDWSNTNGTLAPNHYPLCTLTYWGFWDDYADVYGNTATEQAKARTVKDYITTSLYTGQNVLYANDYTPLPTDLRQAGRVAIINSNWNK